MSLSYKDFDQDKCIIILKHSSGERIYLNGRTIYYCRYKFITSIGKEETYTVVGKVNAFSTEILKFIPMGLEKNQIGYCLSVFISDISIIREFRDTDIPLMINWDWIGKELRGKYFLTR
jgi:hypothetical protein